MLIYFRISFKVRKNFGLLDKIMRQSMFYDIIFIIMMF